MAVLGDGALPSGIVFEAMNNAAGLKKDMVVILNDNKMGICPRVGGLAHYLDKARVAPFYDGLKRDVSWLLNKLPSRRDGRVDAGELQRRRRRRSSTAACCSRKWAFATSARSTAMTWRACGAISSW